MRRYQNGLSLLNIECRITAFNASLSFKNGVDNHAFFINVLKISFNFYLINAVIFFLYYILSRFAIFKFSFSYICLFPKVYHFSRIINVKFPFLTIFNTVKIIYSVCYIRIFLYFCKKNTSRKLGVYHSRSYVYKISLFYRYFFKYSGKIIVFSLF